MSSYTSSVRLCADVISVLKAARFVNDNAPNNSPPPNRPVFRVGVSTIRPLVDDMGNSDKTTTKVGIEIAYFYPIGGGDPQAAELAIASHVERILDTLAKAKGKLDDGTALTFTGAVIRNLRPTVNRADIAFDSVLNLS